IHIERASIQHITSIHNISYNTE
ncbi:unnamed protein product, partial [Allacma fusca]